MTEVILLIVALTAMCCMGCNALVLFLLMKEKTVKVVQPAKTAEEMEHEKEMMRQQTENVKAFEQMMSLGSEPFGKGGGLR